MCVAYTDWGVYLKNALSGSPSTHTHTFLVQNLTGYVRILADLIPIGLMLGNPPSKFQYGNSFRNLNGDLKTVLIKHKTSSREEIHNEIKEFCTHLSTELPEAKAKF